MTLNGAPLANAAVVFTCGCSAQAGEAQTDANGNFVIHATATAIPAQPEPTYTVVPGRNYVVAGFASNGGQAWTMLFMGNSPATNLNLSLTPAIGADGATAAAALYVYYMAQNGSDQSFDLWNYNTISTWTQHLRGGTGLSANEAALLADTASAEQTSSSLYPDVPSWNPQPSAGVNARIRTDILAVHIDGMAVDPLLPTPCPNAGGCTGTPTP
jgi:hypothetical protein